MKSRSLAVAALVAILVVASAGVALSGQNAFFSKEQSETVDLADLYDGETRTIGEGEHAITVVREGDVVRIIGTREKGLHQFSCDVTADDCKVMVAGDSGSTMVMISNSSGCSDGEDCHAMHAGSMGQAHFILKSTVDCEDGEDCDSIDIDQLMSAGGVHALGQQMQWTSASACEDGEDCQNIQVIIDGALEGMPSMGHGMHLRVIQDDTMVRCPEGDTTMRLNDDDADEMYLCPKHSLPLERVKHSIRTKQKVEVRTQPQEY